ncbi:PREDICTED: uncharacterized protein LOC105557607 [Vollenhovia emeryi]|uniref:uncharacterized protein LOC105557607 n=1 Tax=Vollenhovia emeryi TaxID=411798 RepID=UPI0005F46B2A|nr:PREDICTED: uncharacterized protein LOC105557607 [Vollenhovia emeryi]
MTYRITQLLTGHGCFGTFLRRIGKAHTAVCPHCGTEDGGSIDSAEHTIAECPAWQDERDELTAVIGMDLTLTGIVDRMVHSRENWAAFSLFAERVMVAKEEAERRRQAMEEGNADNGNVRDVDSDDHPDIG